MNKPIEVANLSQLMVHIRLSCLLLFFMFTLLEARNSIFKQPPHQDILDTNIIQEIEKKDDNYKINIPTKLVAKEMKFKLIENEKEEGNYKRSKGRKLKSKGSFKKDLEEISMNRMKMGKKSGAKPCSTCNHIGKRKLDVMLCKLNCNNNPTIKPNNPSKLPIGFVALSADYHFPNPHPPHHN